MRQKPANSEQILQHYNTGFEIGLDYTNLLKTTNLSLGGMLYLATKRIYSRGQMLFIEELHEKKKRV